MADPTAQAVFKDIPEFFEVELGESLSSRTETLVSFRELGPPDLCHTIKSSNKHGVKELGSYHYVSGVDASSSASLAAYLNSLTYAIEDQPAWFSKGPSWKVRSGSYCCFNAFSRVDVRVDVKIPGGVSSYVIDLRGERHEATPQIWTETYLSALLRAILYTDDTSYKLVGYRKLEPIRTQEDELRFLAAAEALFPKGWQLGSDPEIQVACLTANHLVTGLMKYFGDSFRLDKAANLFEKLAVREPEINALLAQAYIGMNEEVKAIQIIASSLRTHPPTYTLLHTQSTFLRSKSAYHPALKIAKSAVQIAPSEFTTWAKLTEIYVDLGEWEMALLTLNSCPMFTVNERDLHRMPVPGKTWLPVKGWVTETGILDEGGDEDIDPALQRLPAPALKGTFAQAYKILSRLVSLIGWDELLKARSNVFVMEEEYRMQKAQGDLRDVVGDHSPNSADLSHSSDPSVPSVDPFDLSSRNGRGGGGGGADDNASTRGVVSPALRSRNGELSLETDDGISTSGDGPLSPGVPVIKVSSESDREKEFGASESPSASASTSNGGETKMNGNGEIGGIEKPSAAATPADSHSIPHQSPNGHAHNDSTSTEPGQTGQEASGTGQDGFSFTNKRLCERWLDNLFMCLYEDLRIWTIYRAEVAHFKTQHLAYRKTSSEWEILGELGWRLGHREEAKECWVRCLDGGRFSAKAWGRLLEVWCEEGDVQRSLNAAVRLTVYNYRWYMETSYPTSVAHHIFKLGQIHGHAKISYTLLSMSLPEPIQKAMEGYLNYGKNFGVEGSDF
ncbi:chaps-domain-containing protein [Sistotremastrum niveocremeum HHB9708]|uniref:Chaps-domain-containing protein n=1 Tax=Sistotremastrum niveocremeum HHB9708 TaxID=1314777 RepID=A0A164YXU1_9AGAM|nr:chaps-domain-containing protein [Sistotremastrum niveocremeum HHB9708]